MECHKRGRDYRTDIRKVMLENKGIGVTKIAKVMKISPSTVVRHYMKLKEEGL